MSVYFIRVGRYFKIGTSRDPQQRFQNLHKGNTRYTFPVDASLKLEDRDLYRVIEGSTNDENVIHLALDDFSVGLEWFLDEPALRAFINTLPDRLSLQERLDLPRMDRLGGWCETEYRAVQQGRADREIARHFAKRGAA